MNIKRQRNKEKREMQFASVAQAWRCVKSGQLTLEQVKQFPPDKISKERWSGMLKHREENNA